ncbi:uncharacterized protein LOC134276840 [Saccostrea cucullata]|uniref:uncharacterized protein LOC134276840 n=1 Tax=Saccostrea cuccullata TaxID=36930 RepID=UPI002ED0CC75
MTLYRTDQDSPLLSFNQFPTPDNLNQYPTTYPFNPSQHPYPFNSFPPSTNRSPHSQFYNTNQCLQLRAVKTKSGNCPTNITVSRTGDLIYSDYEDGTVNILNNEMTKIEEVISLQNWKPQGVCSISSGELLITMERDDKTESKVVRYSGFTEKQSIQFDNEGNPLYSSGGFLKSICENRNLDICVADCGARAVVVVNQGGKLRFKYYGQAPAPCSKPLNPKGITTDSQGHIIVSDNENNFVHIIDEDGQFLESQNSEMNPCTSSQDVIRCDVCTTDVVQMHCDPCHVNLCEIQEGSILKLFGSLAAPCFKTEKNGYRMKTTQGSREDESVQVIPNNSSEESSFSDSSPISLKAQKTERLFPNNQHLPAIESLLSTEERSPEVRYRPPVPRKPKLKPSESGSPPPVPLKSADCGAVSQETVENRHPYLDKKLRNEPEIINTEIKCVKNMINIACLGDEKIWLCKGEAIMELYMVNKDSSLESITTKSEDIPTDLAVTKSGNLIYTDKGDGTVNIVIKGKTQELIRLRTGDLLAYVAHLMMIY